MLKLFEEYISLAKKQELEELLKQNPDLAKQKTSSQLSPILLACYLKKPEIAEIILDHISEPSLFEAAAMGRHDWLVHLLVKYPDSINQYAEQGFTALSLAVYFGHEEITRYLLLKGADVNLPSQDQDQIYPLNSAVLSGNNLLAKMLMEAGADVNLKQASGISPLHAAAQMGNIELIILLLEAGADVKSKTEDSKTPGDLAAENGWIDIARILND